MTKPTIPYAAELCQCSHLKTQHNTRYLWSDPHGGNCTQCTCPQFTWKSFVDTDGKYTEPKSAG